jgi:hypothetical protein
MKSAPCTAFVITLLVDMALTVSGGLGATPERLLALRGQSPSDGAVSGSVVDYGSGRPIGRAQVELATLNPPGGLRRLMTTDEMGRFVFHSLPASDSYYLTAFATGHSAARYRNPRKTDQGRPTPAELIHLAKGQWVDDVRIELRKLGAIEGRVLDERGEPVVGVAVRAAVQVMVAGRPQVVGATTTVTDDRGMYRLAELADGAYHVTVQSVQSTVPGRVPEAERRRAIGQLEVGFGIPLGEGLQWPALQVTDSHRLVLSNFPIPPSAGNAIGQGAYAAAWYPSVDRLDLAQAVSVSGEVVPGIDLHLRPLATARLTGRVVPDPGAPMLLRLMRTGEESLGFGFEAATTITESGGEFTFLNIPVGSYTLIAQSQISELSRGSGDVRLPDPPGYPAGPTGTAYLADADLNVIRRSGALVPWIGRQPVTVGSDSPTDVTFALQRTGTVSGRLAFEPGTSAPRGATLSARLESAGGDPGMGHFSVLVDPKTQSFTFEGLQRVKYVLSIASSLTLVSVRVRGVEVQNSILDMTNAIDLDDVVVTLSSRNTSVSGRVAGLGPGEYASVIVFPVEPTFWQDYGVSPGRIRTTTTDADGSYSVRGLAPGTYLAAAVELGQSDTWRDPALLKALSVTSTRIDLLLDRPITRDLAVSKIEKVP